jgi:hypothetical protein
MDAAVVKTRPNCGAFGSGTAVAVSQEAGGASSSVAPLISACALLSVGELTLLPGLDGPAPPDALADDGMAGRLVPEGRGGFGLRVVGRGGFGLRVVV